MMEQQQQQQDHTAHLQQQRRLQSSSPSSVDSIARLGRRPNALAGCSNNSNGRVIVHIDMDCFFAAVAAVGRPEFAGAQ
jgi:hypothetical protein